MARVKRALLSVSNKQGLVDFATGLNERSVTLVSTGGTARVLREAGLTVLDVKEVTGSPEMMDGRVKTLHPIIHGGILARRDHEKDLEQMREHQIEGIDLVVVNLYPFEATVAKSDVTWDQAVEQIDIGGPTMVRAAAKNQGYVGVVTSPQQYDEVLAALDECGGELPEQLRKELAAEAFLHTARYDLAIAQFLNNTGDDKGAPAVWGGVYNRRDALRYGENPHQLAALYTDGKPSRGLVAANQLQGKQLSYNNWLDADGAFRIARDLGPTGVTVVKHSNPCGAARSEQSITEAFLLARACDPVSAFGGIVATMGTVDEALARELVEGFLEVVLAADFTPGARSLLAKKKRLRVLQLDASHWELGEPEWLPRPISGGVLVQQSDDLVQDIDRAKVVTQRVPTAEEWAAMKFGWSVVRHVKSNAIVFAHGDRTVGIGAGQMSRVDSSQIAVMKAQSSLDGTAVASDAFFPFADGVLAAADAGATAVIQPGGSIRDEDVIAAANSRGLAMVFTGNRHFRH